MNGEAERLLASIRDRLQKVEDDMRTLRDAYWSAGNEAASFAVDSARHGVSRSLHDLKRTSTSPDHSADDQTTP